MIDKPPVSKKNRKKPNPTHRKTPTSANNKAKSSVDEKIQKKNLAKSRKRIRRFVIGILVLAGLGAAVAMATNAYKRDWAAERDLSVIGNGVPSIIQVHDGGCRLCRELKSNAEAAMKGFDDTLQYRVADIGTSQGRKLQRLHGVPHVTLLLFDAKGELRKKMQGVRPTHELKEEFTNLVNRRI